jgi:hypothetical protein
MQHSNNNIPTRCLQGTQLWAQLQVEVAWMLL